MVEISTNSEGAELFHEGVSKRGVDSRDDYTTVTHQCDTRLLESTCIWSRRMPNTLGTATIAFIHMAKSFHSHLIVIST